MNLCIIDMATNARFCSEHDPPPKKKIIHGSDFGRHTEFYLVYKVVFTHTGKLADGNNRRS